MMLPPLCLTVGMVLNMLKACFPESLDLTQNDQWFLGYLPDQGPLFPFRSRKILNLFYFRMTTVLLGAFNAAEMFLYPSPDLCLATILSHRPGPPGWVFTVTYPISCGTLYGQMYAFLNDV